MSFPNQYIGVALGITSQCWKDTGLGFDPATAPSDDIDETTNRITALLLIRICAWIMPRGMFTDLSTTTMCRSMLVNDSLWPEQLNEEFVADLKDYVKGILLGYNDVPYHNFKHCYHVTISTNKLVDMIVHKVSDEKPAYTYGFRDDPLMQLALLFSALIHDVDHRGIPNRQLALEDEYLAIKYNDQSVAENESLYIGFSTLLAKKYEKLRKVIFPEREDYRRFRGACINLVLSTDIASPERTQLGKSKWKEAFGDPYETVERKVMKKSLASHEEDPTDILKDMQVGKQGNDDESSIESSLHSSDLEDSSSVRHRRFTNGTNGTNGSDVQLTGKALKFHRRLTQTGTTGASPGRSPGRSRRLGFRRTMDLTGESIETYSGDKRVSASDDGSYSEKKITIVLPSPETIDDVRESVIMETIIKAADVAHNLQGFEQMAKWSDCLYLELRKAHIEKRGEDPSNGWFNNQIGFLDFYLLPLARKLDDTGAFGDTRGAIFASIVERNRSRWTREGMNVTMNIVVQGSKDYPDE